MCISSASELRVGDGCDFLQWEREEEWFYGILDVMASKDKKARPTGIAGNNASH